VAGIYRIKSEEVGRGLKKSDVVEISILCEIWTQITEVGRERKTSDKVGRSLT
jgi:hypothetical protein